ncbi:MAG: hypothetical protein JSV88_22250 [Candidatus Aminicenantes bacterium]|nr:MAG: hypothetical protein JSV88_22250 [Candidatus Aminicenantes bacterium]
MRKISYVMIIIFMGGGLFLFPERLATLPEIMKPASISVENNQLYIVEKSTIYLYSTKDFKLVKQFGRKGEGPGEFKNIPILKVFPDYLLINSFGKFMYFSRNGEFLREKKIPRMFIFPVLPVGENFVGMEMKFNRESKKGLTAITIFDKDLKTIKVIAESERRRQGISGTFEMEMVRDHLRYDVSGENVFVGDTKKGFFIEVFNSKGNKLYQIKKEYEKLEVTDEYKNNRMESMKKSPYFNQVKDRFKFTWRKYFPAFGNFSINNGKIYVFTYKKKDKDKKREVIVMDLKGSILKKTFLPDGVISSINNDRFYYLKENEEEEWELFVESI